MTLARLAVMTLAALVGMALASLTLVVVAALMLGLLSLGSLMVGTVGVVVATSLVGSSSLGLLLAGFGGLYRLLSSTNTHSEAESCKKNVFLHSVNVCISLYSIQFFLVGGLFVGLCIAYPGLLYGKGDSQKGENQYNKQRIDEVLPAHGDRECVGYEISSHLDDAKLLLNPADDKSYHLTGHDSHQGYHDAFGKECATQIGVIHTHAAQGVDVLSLVDDEERKTGYKIQSGNKYYEAEYEHHAQSLALEHLVVKGLLLEAVAYLVVVSYKRLYLLLDFVEMAWVLQGDGKSRNLVLVIVHQLAYKVGMSHNIAVINILLQIEAAGRIGMTRIEGLAHRHSYAASTLGDIDCEQTVGIGRDAQIVVDLASEYEIVGLLLDGTGLVVGVNGLEGVAQTIASLIEHRIETRHLVVVVVYATQLDNSLVMLVGYPGILLDEGAHLVDAIERT